MFYTNKKNIFIKFGIVFFVHMFVHYSSKPVIISLFTFFNILFKAVNLMFLYVHTLLQINEYYYYRSQRNIEQKN